MIFFSAPNPKIRIPRNRNTRSVISLSRSTEINRRTSFSLIGHSLVAWHWRISSGVKHPFRRESQRQKKSRAWVHCSIWPEKSENTSSKVGGGTKSSFSSEASISALISGGKTGAGFFFIHNRSSAPSAPVNG